MFDQHPFYAIQNPDGYNIHLFLIGVLGLIFVIPSVLHFVFHKIPEFIMEYCIILFPVYFLASIFIVSGGILFGIISAIVVTFTGFDILFNL